MPMKNPVHPGQSIGHDCLVELGLTITTGAKLLGVSRTELYKLINGRASVTPEMAIRLSKVIGSPPEFWLRLQFNYDLAQVRKLADEIKLERYRPNGGNIEEDTFVYTN